MNTFINRAIIVFQFWVLAWANDCKKASECPAALQHTNDDGSLNEMFLAKFTCGFEGPTPRYSCNEIPNITNKQTITKSRFFGVECVTTNGQKGICAELSQCPDFMRKIRENSKYLELVTSSKCELQSNISLYCCGDDEFDYQCGISYNGKVDKIHGGTETKIHEYPWMVLLIYSQKSGGDKFRCGGSLINSQFVLTAAHCILDELIGVRIGVYKNDDENSQHQDVAIKSISTHEGYYIGKHSYDIGLLKIAPVEPSVNVGWICLPNKNTPIPKKFMVVGYGDNDKNVKTFTVQYRASLPFVDESTCLNYYKSNSYDFTTDANVTLCAGGEPGVDSCSGDSGGPLMSRGATPYWYLFGVVSTGYRNCSLGRPGLYTKITPLLPWIKNKMLQML